MIQYLWLFYAAFTALPNLPEKERPAEINWNKPGGTTAMLELVICDDEKLFRHDLKRMLSTDLELSGIEYRIREFTCAEELLDALECIECHILFLDIEMKGINGIEAARKLRGRSNQAQIIFVTSHPDFVFQGYEVRALNYILKPFEPARILSVLHTAIQLLDIAAERYYIIEQRAGSIRVPVSSIKYFSSEKRVVHAVTEQGNYTFYEKLGNLEADLKGAFVRIHNRYLIHLKYLSQIDGNTAVIDGEPLPVSRSFKSALSIAFAKYMLS